MPDSLLTFARKAVQAALEQALAQSCRPAPRWGAPLPAVLALDATAGNGVDTEWLARAVGINGLVLAFDVQEEALRKTRERLEASIPPLAGGVRLVPDSHANLALYLTPYLTSGLKVNAAMYNLGFLPGAASPQPPLTTLPASTLASLTALLPCLAPGAAVSVHCYAGHEQGEAETSAVTAWATALPWRDWRVLRYEFCNKPSNRETLLIINKL